MEIYNIQSKKDLLIYLQTLAERVSRCGDIEVVWGQEIDKLNVLIKGKHGHPWVRVLIAKMLADEGIKNALLAKNSSRIKNIILNIQNRWQN